MNKKTYQQVNAAQWIYRLAFNAQLETEYNQSHHRKECILQGLDKPKRLSKFDVYKQLTTLRHDDISGPAMPEAKAFPAVMLRAAVEEAHDSVSNCIKKWAASKRASMPKYRKAHDEQTITITAFTIQFIDKNPEVKQPRVKLKIQGFDTIKVRLSRAFITGHTPVAIQIKEQNCAESLVLSGVARRS